MFKRKSHLLTRVWFHPRECGASVSLAPPFTRSHGGEGLTIMAQHQMHRRTLGAEDTCRLCSRPRRHKNVCVYQLLRVPPLRFRVWAQKRKKNGSQYKFLPPSRLWHWQEVQSAENLKTLAGILALCTTGVPGSEPKQAFVIFFFSMQSWGKILTLSWIWVGSAGKFLAGHSVISHAVLCWLWVDFFWCLNSPALRRGWFRMRETSRCSW